MILFKGVFLALFEMKVAENRDESNGKAEEHSTF